MVEGKWQDWTSCEMYGHNYEDSSCTDCNEPREVEDNDTANSEYLYSTSVRLVSDR